MSLNQGRLVQRGGNSANDWPLNFCQLLLLLSYKVKRSSASDFQLIIYVYPQGRGTASIGHSTGNLAFNWQIHPANQRNKTSQVRYNNQQTTCADQYQK